MKKTKKVNPKIDDAKVLEIVIKILKIFIIGLQLHIEIYSNC